MAPDIIHFTVADRGILTKLQVEMEYLKERLLEISGMLRKNLDEHEARLRMMELKMPGAQCETHAERIKALETAIVERPTLGDLKRIRRDLQIVQRGMWMALGALALVELLAPFIRKLL